MTNKATIDLIKKYESLHDGDLSQIGLQPKRCPTGIWTIGYGHALRTEDGARFLSRESDKDEAYRQAGTITEDQANAYLHTDLLIFENAVKGMARVKLSNNELGALVSLAYNIGTTALKNSTLLQRLNIGDYQGAANSFLMWNKGTVNGKKVILKGLTARRKAEKELFMS